MAPGPYTIFAHMNYVHLLRLGHERFRFERAQGATYRQGGYEVDLIYRVEGPLGAFEVQVGTDGQEVTDATGTHRQWHVNRDRLRIVRTLSSSPEAQAMEDSSREASKAANDWAAKLRLHQPVSAYLDTLPPESRRRLFGAAVLEEPGLLAATGLTLAGAWGATPGTVDSFRQGYARFREAGLLDAGGLWVASEAYRKPMAEQARKLLSADPGVRGDISPMESARPVVKREGDRGEFIFPFRIVLLDPSNRKPLYLLEADVVVAGPLTGRASSYAYRIDKVRLVRGQLAPATGPPRP
jgi:hypothetical protein